MRYIIIVILALLGITSCSQQKKAETDAPASKILVLYYSQTGATKAVAEELQKQLDADIEEIEVEEPYSGDFDATIERCKKEMEAGTTPKVKPVKAELDKYDIIFLGYPVWFGTYARPIAGLVQKETFKGKKIVTFCTFGSGGLQSSTQDLQKALPQAEVLEGYGVRNARISVIGEEINRFLIEHGYKNGEVEALPAFMEHKPVTKEDITVFNEACGDYQFPLGTPVTVAARETSASTDYEYSVRSQGVDGVETMTTIYVTRSKKQGSKAEFTQVVR